MEYFVTVSYGSNAFDVVVDADNEDQAIELVENRLWIEAEYLEEEEAA